jgi:hydrogenase nickel incorporation protein HypB
VVLNKIDLLTYVPFDVSRFIEQARHLNPALRVLEVAATRGDGLGEWCDRLRAQAADRTKCPP